MSNTQFYLVIGVPIVVNAIFNAMLVGLTWMHFDARIDELLDRPESQTAKVNR